MNATTSAAVTCKCLISNCTVDCHQNGICLCLQLYKLNHHFQKYISWIRPWCLKRSLVYILQSKWKKKDRVNFSSFLQGMCWILETLIQSGWEISTSCLTSVTTGYDTGSFFLKKNTAPALHNAQVAAVLVDQHNGKVEVLSHRRGEKHVDINNAVHRAVKKITNANTTPNRNSRSTPASSNEG